MSAQQSGHSAEGVDDRPKAEPKMAEVLATPPNLVHKGLFVNTSAPIDYSVGLNDAVNGRTQAEHLESMEPINISETPVKVKQDDKSGSGDFKVEHTAESNRNEPDVVRNGVPVEGVEPSPKSGINGENPPLVTDATRVSELRSVSLETIGALGGWTAKRVSVTGQLFFERDTDGKISLARPAEALAAVRLAEEQDETHAEVDAPSQPTTIEHVIAEKPKEKTPPPSVLDMEEDEIETPDAAQSLLASYLSDKPLPLTPETVAQLHAQEGNDRCVDCGVGQPTWASLSFGVLLCVGCSGAHRSWGSHVSVVKSLTLDNWTAEQLAFVHPFGGNAKFRTAVVKADGGKPSARYATEEASKYRARLRALVKKEPLLSSPKPALRSINNVPSPISSSSAAGLAMLAAGSPPSTPRRNGRMQQESKEATACLLCGRSFSVVVRKHICKNCDRAVCARCAPGANTKPLPHLGLGMTPQRHCFKCYRSPFIDWSSVGLSSAELAAEAQVSAESTPTQRRKTLGAPKNGGAQQRRKTLGEALAGMMKRG